MQRTFVVLVEDKRDVLNRVTSLFRRRAFEVESLTFARTSERGVSQIQAVVECDAAGADRLMAYLHRLIEVLHVECDRPS